MPFGKSRHSDIEPVPAIPLIHLVEGADVANKINRMLKDVVAPSFLRQRQVVVSAVVKGAQRHVFKVPGQDPALLMVPGHDARSLQLLHQLHDLVFTGPFLEVHQFFSG